ncbi:MAG: GspH/FimT family pseudopilin [Gammaproteobacteria bacterium]|nr:GspH/FimT family pseudopilin [Gammaproteobacteria bacterium]
MRVRLDRGGCSGRAHPGSAGFTLLELLVVLAILALVSTVTAVRFSGGIDSARLRAETRQMVALLRAARVEAMVSSSVTGIDAAQDDTGYLRYPAQDRITLPEGIAIAITADAAAALPAIRFYPDGSSSGGAVRLSSAAGSYAVNVAWLTGEVSLTDGD